MTAVVFLRVLGLAAIYAGAIAFRVLATAADRPDPWIALPIEIALLTIAIAVGLTAFYAADTVGRR